MDQIRVNNVNTIEVAAELAKADILSNRKQSEFPVLEDWEMVLAGGGEGVVIW